jgi:hypothetical protein
MHKVKNKFEVNCANITPECDDLSAPDKVSQDLQDLGEEDTIKKKRMSYEELEKLLYDTLTSKASLIGINKKL